MSLRDVAFEYFQSGLNIVVSKAKQPLVKWSKWQTERQAKVDFDIMPWDQADGFAVVCGRPNNENLFFGVVDLDVKNLSDEAIAKGREAVKVLPITRTEKTPSGGLHFAFLTRTKPDTISTYHDTVALELLGEGKLCFMSPSLGYSRINDNTLSVIEDLEGEFLSALLSVGVKPSRPEYEKEASEQHGTIGLEISKVIDLQGFSQSGNEYFGSSPFHGSASGRNFWVNNAKNVWHCFRCNSGGGPLSLLAIKHGLLACQEARPGALKGELFKKALKIAEQDYGLTVPQAASEQGKSQADKLVALCLLENPKLFTDQTGMPFAWINQKGVHVTLPLRSRLCKSWLSSLLWEAEEKAPGNEAISSALNILVSKAMFDGPRITLYNRVAPGENCFWIDMTDDKHRAIKITSEGWVIVDDPPILFKRYSHQLPLAIPTRGCSAWRLLDFFNVVTTEEERKKNDSEDMLPNSRLVILCQCIGFLVPNIPHPILLLYGTQGSGKSLIFKLLKKLLDPSSIELLTLPRSENERIQQLEHHWLCAFDNVTHLPDWMSDTLCRAVTGSGFSKRELYTDDEDVLYSFIRCVLLNGINIAAQKGDLLDRSTIEGLVNIEKESRRTEEALLVEFEKCKPELLGAFLDVLVKAMQLYPKVNPTKLFRMADFTKWGIAISQALGNTEKEFLDAYELKVKTQSEEAAHASPVATVLLDSFSTAKEPWEGTPTQLYMRLNEHAKMLGISTRQKAWPKAPNTLVRRLNELAPSLKSLDLEIETGIREGHGGPRKIWINTVTTVTTDTNHEKHVEEGDDKGDDKGDDSKNEPSPEPSPLEHGQRTLGDDGDDGDSNFTDNSRKVTEAPEEEMKPETSQKADSSRNLGNSQAEISNNVLSSLSNGKETLLAFCGKTSKNDAKEALERESCNHA